MASSDFLVAPKFGVVRKPRINLSDIDLGVAAVSFVLDF
jgi:hypothetical protein